MKKSILTKVFALSLLAVLFVACNKYEEGANFSFISAKGRLVNDWKLSQYTVESGGFTQTGTVDLKVSIKKDGTTTTTWTSGSSSMSDNGTWEFNSDKTAVTFTDSNSGTQTMTIKKLKNKELTLVYVDGNITTTYEYVQQ